MDEVIGWLASIGLPQYAANFVDNEIDPSLLGELTDQFLRDIGVGPVGHRMRILRAVAARATAAAAAPPEPATTTDPEPGAPAALSTPRAADAKAERRHLTVMFCDLVGSTALAARLDPEDMREVVRAYQGACAQVIARYEGFVAQYLGDGIMAYFGYPQAHEDDAERAVRAGLDLIAAVTKLDIKVKVEVRVGIATGLVVVGDLIGEHAAKERAVTGETPNLAARLQGLAAPGSTVVSAATRRLLGAMFELRDLGAQAMKGLDAPVQAFAVEGVRSFESRFEARAGGLTGFVGREEECEHLFARKKLAWQGRGQVVLLSGEAGIGKSRLAAWLVDEIGSEPHMRLRYQCTPHHKDSALYPTIAHLERAAAIEANQTAEAKLAKLEALLALAGLGAVETVPLFAALLAIPTGDKYPPLAMSPGQQRQRTMAAMLDQIEGLAKQKPLLMIYEDAHWADATSLELLDSLVDRIVRLPVLVVVTGRPEFSPAWAGRHNVSTLSLLKLDKRHVRAMVESVSGGASLPTDVMDQIVAKTDGVPLFVEELTKTVLESGAVAEDGRSIGAMSAFAIPATLQDSLMARLDRSNPVKEIAQIGAAIGREFSYRLLLAVAGMDEATIRTGLAKLEETELASRRGVPPDATYTFKHALVQDAAYESLLKSRRQVIHRRIAKVLRDQFPVLAETEPEIIAHHFAQAERIEQAVEWWTKAGTTAFRRAALAEAINHFERAIGLADSATVGRVPAGQRYRLQRDYSWTLAAQAPGDKKAAFAFAHLNDLAEHEDDAEKRLDALCGKWICEASSGQIRASIVTSDLYVKESVRLNSKKHLPWAINQTAQSLLYTGDYINALKLFEDLDLSKVKVGVTYDTSTTNLCMAAFALMVRGENEQAFVTLKRAMERAQDLKLIANTLNVLYRECIFWSVCGNADQTRNSSAELARLAAEHRATAFVNVADTFVAWVAWHQGHKPEARGAMEKYLAHLGPRGSQTNPLFFTFWARMLAEADCSRASAVIDGALIDNETTANHWYDAEMLRYRAAFQGRALSGSLSEAEQSLLRSLAVSRAQGARTFELRASLDLARLYRDTGRGRETRDLLGPALVGFTETPELPEIGEAQRLLAAVS